MARAKWVGWAGHTSPACRPHTTMSEDCKIEENTHRWQDAKCQHTGLYTQHNRSSQQHEALATQRADLEGHVQALQAQVAQERFTMLQASEDFERMQSTVSQT